MEHKGRWKVTDPSCGQRCRRIDGLSATGKPVVLYEFEQTMDGLFGSAVINLEDYAGEEDFATKYLLPYGYDSIERMKDLYGDAWRQVAAECVFETDFYEFVL